MVKYSLEVKKSAQSHTGHTYCLAVVIDDVDKAVISDTDAPVIFVALQLLASCGPWVVGQRQNLLVQAREHRLTERIQFL